MKKFGRSILFVLLIVSFGSTSTPQQNKAEKLYQEALYQMEGIGDFTKAIELFNKIVKEFPKDKSTVAMALVQMGQCYEKLGKAEARKAYERVVREYADQAEAVQLARARLEFLVTGASTADSKNSPSYTLVLGELPPFNVRLAAQFDFSPDGERVIFGAFTRVPTPRDTMPSRQLYISDRTGTVIRPLLDDPGPWQWYNLPRWSPDGRYIAYFARRPAGTADSLIGGLFVLRVDGGSPRQLDVNVQPTQAGLTWTSDGKNLTVFAHDGFHTIDLDGKAVRTVPMKLHYTTRFGGYSPDGRWLAFHVINEGTEQDLETDVWVLPAEGGRAMRVTHAPGFDGSPTWAHDGLAIYFVSDRDGSFNIWKQEFDTATGNADGDAQQVTFYNDAAVHYPKVVEGGRRMAFALTRRNTAIHVALASRPEAKRTVARGVYPELSSDGKMVYYVGEGAGQEGIFAVSADGGMPRRLTRTEPAARFLRRFHLSPDGRTVAYFSRVGEETMLYTVSIEGGEPRQLLRLASKEQLAPSWSPDGSLLAYSTGNGLYVIPAQGGEPKKLAHLYSWDGWNIRWSPDGKYIAALAYARPGNEEQNAVFVVPASGGEPRRLTPPEEKEYKEGLEWHPDGQRLTYMYYGPDGIRQVYLDGRPITSLVNQPEPLWDYVGNWAPDGRHFFFISATRGIGNPWGLYKYDDVSKKTTVFSPPEADTGLPSWSRDGTIMAWTTMNRVHQLWVMENFR